MRKRKSEEVRRLIRAAASLCDLSSLNEVRKKLSEAARELDRVDSEKQRKNKTEDLPRKKFGIGNPLEKIRAIEIEIMKEKEKFSGDEDLELMNG